MKILYVDDDRSAHRNFYYATKAREDIQRVEYAFDYDSAIDYASTHEINCAFLDISLAGQDGIELAKTLSSMQPKLEVAFVTGFDEHAREAYKVGGRAYITKPYSEREINEALDFMGRLVHLPAGTVMEPYEESKHILAKTFGTFDLMVDGYPVHFKNAKAKELLAFLVHQMGGSVTNAQIFYALWEQQEYTHATSTYVRRTIRALKAELEQLEIADILRAERNSLSLDWKKFTCDAYELMKKNATAMCKYNGQYMSQYSWGEEFIPVLDRIVHDTIH